MAGLGDLVRKLRKPRPRREGGVGGKYSSSRTHYPRVVELASRCSIGMLPRYLHWIAAESLESKGQKPLHGMARWCAGRLRATGGVDRQDPRDPLGARAQVSVSWGLQWDCMPP